MLHDKTAAAEMSKELREAFACLDRSAAIMRKHATEEESKAYLQKVGGVLYGIIFKLMEPLYFEHPDLRPEGWDDLPPMDPDRFQKP